MQLRISHTTTYEYDKPLSGGLQRLRLVPRNGSTQVIGRWETTVDGGTKQVSFTDHFGNQNELVTVDPGATRVVIASAGDVETTVTSGIVGASVGYAPLWLFTRSTPMTAAGTGVAALADSVSSEDGDMVAQLHRLAQKIPEQVTYETGHTAIGDSPEHVLALGHGVCQDHAHVFVAAARTLGVPARYVSGYLMMTDRADQDATHAWAEAWVEQLGWVGFDPSNGISPDERYVRIAVGLDYHDAAPVAGVRSGAGNETLNVSVHVEQ